MSRFTPLFFLVCCSLIVGCGSKKTDASETGTAKGPQPSALQNASKSGPDFSKILRSPKLATHQAPNTFTVKLETTVGDILLDATRAWSPKGVDRFYNLVRAGYYTDIAFFRVIPGFMAQVGISGDPSLNAVWHRAGIPDDPMVADVGNSRGMISYAKGGPNSRSTQFFINFGNNRNLDSMDFPPIAKAQAQSMKVIDKIYSGYGECGPSGRGPWQSRLHERGTPYLKKEFPQLTYIKSATIVRDQGAP